MGKHIIGRWKDKDGAVRDSHPYNKWIEMYGGPDFDAATREACGIWCFSFRPLHLLLCFDIRVWGLAFRYVHICLRVSEFDQRQHAHGAPRASAMLRAMIRLPASSPLPSRALTVARPRLRPTSDTLAATASEATRKDMVHAYLQAARFEWMFWDAAYHSKVWPINYDGSISP